MVESRISGILWDKLDLLDALPVGWHSRGRGTCFTLKLRGANGVYSSLVSGMSAKSPHVKQ